MRVIVLTYDGFAETNHAINVASLKVTKKVGTSRLYIEETPANILRKKYLEQDKEGQWIPSQQQGQEMAFTTNQKDVVKLIKEKITDLANVEAGEVIDLTPEPVKKEEKKPARKKVEEKAEEEKPVKKSTKRKKAAKKAEPEPEKAPVEKKAAKKKPAGKKKTRKKKSVEKDEKDEYDAEIRKEVLMKIDSDDLFDACAELDIFPDTDAPSAEDLVKAILDYEDGGKNLVSFE